MTSISLLLLLLTSLFLFSNCGDEERESRKRGQSQLITSLVMAGVFRPYYCSSPEIVLEDGKANNITLTKNKPYYIDFNDRKDFGSGKRLRFRITIDKDSSTSIDFFSEDDCTSSMRPVAQVPIQNLPTQLIVEGESWGYSNGVGKDAFGFYFMLKSGNSNVNMTYSKL